MAEECDDRMPVRLEDVVRDMAEVYWVSYDPSVGLPDFPVRVVNDLGVAMFKHGGRVVAYLPRQFQKVFLEDPALAIALYRRSRADVS